MPARIPAHVREQQINDLPNISFVRWADGYQGNISKAICRCGVDGFEWSTTINHLVNYGSRCPECVGKRRITSDERITQINKLPNISFVRWDNGYKNASSKAVCKCAIDGYEWGTSVAHLISHKAGCPQCAGNRHQSAAERAEQINNLPNIRLVRFEGKYKNVHSKAIVQCSVDGHEWVASIHNLVHKATGCPRCAESGYNPAKPGTLYALRSECGSMMKIGISNSYEQRHTQLRRATPFNWHCVELLHGDGAAIAEFEKELHSWTEQIDFSEPFDGYTEWRKWDERLPQWINRHRARLARIVAP